MESMKKVKYKDYDKKLFRFTNILAKLNNGAMLSNKELAEEFNVSTKTIQRDFEKLVTLYPIHKKGRQWVMDKEYEFNEQLCLEDDLTLKLLGNISSSFDKVFAKRASRLLERVHQNTNSPFYAKIELEDLSHKLDEIAQIEEAIKNSKEIIFTYLKKTDYFHITVQPYKIVSFEGFWYLVAKSKGVLKKYYLQNIFDVEVLETSFRKSKKVEASILQALNIWFNDEDTLELEILVDKSVMQYFQRKQLNHTQRLKEFDKDGNMIITLQIAHENEIIPVIKYWLPHLKILKPQKLHEKIIKDVQNFLKWT